MERSNKVRAKTTLDPHKWSNFPQRTFFFYTIDMAVDLGTYKIIWKVPIHCNDNSLSPRSEMTNWIFFFFGFKKKLKVVIMSCVSKDPLQISCVFVLDSCSSGKCCCPTASEVLCSGCKEQDDRCCLNFILPQTLLLFCLFCFWPSFLHRPWEPAQWSACHHAKDGLRSRSCHPNVCTHRPTMP